MAMGRPGADASDEAVRAAALMAAAWEEVRAIAGRLMRRERAGHTLQPTAIVNEAFLRLAAREGLDSVTKHEFLQIAAQAMRRILVDHARRKRARKRGGDGRRVTLETSVLLDDTPTPALPGKAGGGGIDLADIDDALVKLARLDERQAKVVEMRFFAGMTIDEIAEALGVSRRTVQSDWTFARAWLRKELE